ncbi:MAG: diaminopimelate epimerase [Dehalococcoidia bacterium]|nr:diaminopimelate epimerase [Dehalococcoidia bacterium]
MKFSKFQATGNDFILVDARAPSCHSEGEKRPKNFAQSKLREESHWAQLAQTMCDRHFGVGADGLILVQNSSYCDLKMRIFNPDGSEAETCGNGLRCLAKYAIEKGIVSTTNLRIETLSGMRQAKAYMLGNKVSRVEVSMGTPQFQPEQIPVTLTTDAVANEAKQSPVITYQLTANSYQLSVSLLSMGNPHAVSFVSEPVANFPLAEVGPKVERHPLFPQRTNFEIARVLSRGKIDARVWERGVGETLACGSGACAIAVAAQLHNYVGDIVDIILPGGTLTISWDRVGEVLLTGPVDEVFIGEYLTKGE